MAHTSSESSRKHTSTKAAAHRETPHGDSGKQPGNGVDRGELIAVAAYYRAEHRGFNGGDPLQDWLQAEAEIDAEFNRPHEVAVH